MTGIRMSMPSEDYELTDRRDRMLVIGAGPVGLGIARALAGREIPYDQVEATGAVGGNWSHRIYRSAHIISSKRTTEFPEYPMPDDYPDFPSADQMLAYLSDYADHFDLTDKVEFDTCVEEVEERPEGTWETLLASGERRLYRGLMVCNGHHWDRRWPDYPGRFEGEFIHSRDYIGPEQLSGKRVLVIGGGNSACDIASEAARVAEECHLSLRRGYWFLPKTMMGRPFVELAKPWMPVPIQRLMIRTLLKFSVGDYRDYGLPKPDHKIFEHHPTISTEILHYLKHGRIETHPDIRRFDGLKVEFEDGSSIEVDMLVCATGYHVSYPMLPKGMVEINGVVPQVVGQAMVPGHRNLYLVGWSQPRYGFGPLISEGAELLCDVIETQNALRRPLGTILWSLGQRPPKSHLVNPHSMLRQMRRNRRMLPLIARIGAFREKRDPMLG